MRNPVFRVYPRLGREAIDAYNYYVRLLSPEPAVVEQPQSTRVEEPRLLCTQMGNGAADV